MGVSVGSSEILPFCRWNDYSGCSDHTRAIVDDPLSNNTLSDNKLSNNTLSNNKLPNDG